MELFDVSSSGVLSLNSLQIENLNATVSCSMASSKIIVHLVHSSASCQVSVFLVNVSGSHSTVVSQSETKIFDDCRTGFRNLITCQNLTSALLYFVDLA